MKVLYIVTAYDRRPGDGITPWLVETIRRLGDRGVEVEVLAPSYRGLESGFVEGVMVHRFRYAPARLETLTHDQTAPDRLRERPLYATLLPGYLGGSVLAARRLARSGAFDLVHVHWPLPHVVPGWAARRAGDVPLILTFHGVELTFARSAPVPFLVPLLRRAIRTADAVTANSSYTAGLIQRLHDRRVHIIPFGSTVQRPTGDQVTDGVSEAHGAESGHRSSPPSGGPFRLLFVGRLVERKGVHHLLDALTSVSPEVTLHVVGEGPMRAGLEARARELALDQRVHFHGFVDDRALARHYAMADAFVLPAVYDAKGDVEGLGVVLIEAASAGLPLIASDAGGIPDIVRDGRTGILVPPGDAGGLACAIEDLARDPERAADLGRAARRDVRERFAWPAIIRRLADLYESLADVPHADRGKST